MNQLIEIVLPAILTAASASFAADSERTPTYSECFGDCYGQFHFTDRKSEEFCKPNISERQCLALVEHYEIKFKEKYPSFYHARLVLDSTQARRGCAFSKPFPK